MLIMRAMLFVFLISMTFPAFAEEVVAVKDVVAVLEQGFDLLSDLRAEFAQKTVLTSVNREERGAGELFLKKSDAGSAKFRFDYRKPQRQQIISDGRTVWFYLPEEKQVMVMDASALFQGGNAIALSYLTGMGRVSKDFNISFAGNVPDSKGNYLLIMVPKKPAQGVAKLEILISGQAVKSYMAGKKATDPFPIVASVLHDPLGNKTFLDFANAKVNAGLAGSLFAFKIPKGVEVIKP